MNTALSLVAALLVSAWIIYSLLALLTLRRLARQQAIDLLRTQHDASTQKLAARTDYLRLRDDLEEAKRRLGRRMAELRLEKERILHKRGPVSWFARELGWHILPEQYGELANLLSPEQLDDLVGLFDAADDNAALARWDELGGMEGPVLGALTHVANERQRVNIGRLQMLIERRRAGRGIGALA